MGPKLKPTNNGPMDKFVKIKTDNQNGGSNQPPNLQPVAETPHGCTSPLVQSQRRSSPVSSNPLDRKEAEPHETHSFEWCWSDKKPTTFTCNKAGTVEDVLKRSSQFKEIAGKNQNKELVIVRDGKAISSHFPCCLIKKERLTVKYVKAVNKPKQPVNGSVHRQRKRSCGELVMFNLLTKGGKKVVNIMRNPALKTEIQEITVYAYKDEKVKQALKRDGRLLHTMFTKNCVLSHTSSEVTTEMSNLVDDLDGKSFKIILLNKCTPPESQPGSLDDAYMQNESQISDPNGDQDPPQQSTTTDSLNANTPKEKPKLNGNMAGESMYCELPKSKSMQNRLFSQFQHLMKAMKTQRGYKLSRIQSLFRVEYGKNDQTCREVKTMKKLMDLSNSVCHVRINGRAGGSGFLLFHKFVLTNGHVVKDIYNESRRQLDEKVTVHFSYESLDQMDSGAAVEEVVGFEYCRDVSGHMYDWALLRLCADQELPDVLLTRFGFLPQSGGICIIGHPYGGVKKIDPCLIIQTEDRNRVVDRHQNENPEGVVAGDSDYSENQGHIQLVTHQFFEGVAESLKQNRQDLLYESCFYFGSSGSPVFDEHCNVVAMHSGGYAYHNAKNKIQSVIEFGHPLSIIIERIIVQTVERQMFDVLKEYLDCDFAHQQNVMSNLKNLVEGRNLIAFKNAINNSLPTNDESLKKFFEFFSQREEPVPMDID